MLKWHNISKFYYMNLLVYVLTMLVLSTYILLLHSGYEPESLRVEILSYFFNCIYIIHGVFVIQDPAGNFVVRAWIFHHDPSSSRVFPARHRSTSLSLQSGKLR